MTASEWRRRVRRVTHQLQTLTGETPERAILTALEFRLAQLTGPASPTERVQQALAELADRTPSRPGTRQPPAPADYDKALGYGHEGV